METNNQRYVIATMSSGKQRAFTFETFQLMAAEFSFLISHAQEVDALPEGMESPTPIRDAQVRGVLP